MEVNPQIFREYDIRGTADKDLDSDSISKISRALGTFFLNRKQVNIAVGYDCRVSSPRLRDEIIEGLTSCGIKVSIVGMVPTPLLYFAVSYLDLDGGVMITGSHNPPEHNGLKICSGKSTIFGADIQEIRKIAMSEDFAQGKGSTDKIPISSRYIDYVFEGITHPLPIRVVVDNGNGVGGPVAVELYRRLGCEVFELFTEPDGNFPNHHPDPTELTNLSYLIDEVRRRDADVGIAFDGDADRIGAVDEKGKPIFGDELLVIYAREVLKKHPGAAIISEVKASNRLFNDIKSRGGNGIMWKTGHSLIKSKMAEEKALLAGEMSGHMFFKDRYFGFDDAIYAGARLMETIHLTQQKPSELLKGLPNSFTTPEIRKECPDDIKFDVVEQTRAVLVSKRPLRIRY